MRKMPYNKDRLYDEGLDFVIKSASTAISDKQDDFLLLIVGATGSGKSRLMKHILEKFLGDEASMEYVGLDKASFSKALNKASIKPHPRFCCYDEADIDRRGSLTSWNKEVISLYYAIRGLNIFHVWCNPSAEAIDKRFIKERIKGLIFIFNKDESIRLYYYFTKQQLLTIYDKYNNLDLKLLKKIGKAHAFFRGWFRDYKGRLLDDYMQQKQARQLHKVKEFYEKWGVPDEKIPRPKLRKALGISMITFIKYETQLAALGKINERDTFVSATGNRFYPIKYIEIFRNHIENERKNIKYPKNLRKHSLNAGTGILP